jgi:hypothetical protein
MDIEEVEKLKRYEQEQTQRLEQWKKQQQQKLLLQQQQQSQKDSKQIQESAQEKLQRLLNPSSTTRFRLDISEDDEEEDEQATNGYSFPPPILPPPVGPIAAGAAVVVGSDAVLPPPPSYYDVVAPPKPPPPSSVRIPVRTLQDLYKQRFVQARKANRIQIRSLSTYQGRVSGSTNGCTVISALCAATHLNNHHRQSSSSSTGITDAQIEEIIDRTCIPYLQKIRSKLGLSGAALIIPSDVHDHLVDEKILHPEYFAGASGGNILDENHVQELWKLLSMPPSTSTSNNNNHNNHSTHRAAATLFFREHVISIVKEDHPPYQYHVIDSLPNSPYGTATRTTCIDIDHLQIYLNHYTISKFSPNNMEYIDRTPWDDGMADLDPRVFQGFVWSMTNR